jgi:NADP-reducing hydrogenase subunit HndB
VVFGFVNKTKAEEIIDNYIKKGELVDGIIPINFKTIDE